MSVYFFTLKSKGESKNYDKDYETIAYGCPYPCNRLYRITHYCGSCSTDAILVLPASAGEKNFESEERIKLINPQITAEGYKIGTRGFTNYILSADDMVKA